MGHLIDLKVVRAEDHQTMLEVHRMVWDVVVLAADSLLDLMDHLSKLAEDREDHQQVPVDQADHLTN